jgi:hypothetical protein
MNKVTILDDVLPVNQLQFIYHTIIGEPVWTLNMKSENTDFTIPGAVLYDKHLGINTQSKSQMFASMIYMMIQERVDFLSNDIHRIHLGAKANLQDDNFHIDSLEDCYTVLFYLNPIWDKKWGGETYINKEKIEYKPNRALIYSSRLLHGGMGPKSPNLRTYINYVVGRLTK